MGNTNSNLEKINNNNNSLKETPNSQQKRKETPEEILARIKVIKLADEEAPTFALVENEKIELQDLLIKEEKPSTCEVKKGKRNGIDVAVKILRYGPEAQGRKEINFLK